LLWLFRNRSVPDAASPFEIKVPFREMNDHPALFMAQKMP
jgi:hypothetical protein